MHLQSVFWKVFRFPSNSEGHKKLARNKLENFKNFHSPKCLKNIQKLTGRVAALGRFISRSIDKCLPFYNLLKGNKKFVGDQDYEATCEKLKEYLSKLLILSKSLEGEALFLYFAVSDHTINRVLV